MVYQVTKKYALKATDEERIPETKLKNNINHYVLSFTFKCLNLRNK